MLRPQSLFRKKVNARIAMERALSAVRIAMVLEYIMATAMAMVMVTAPQIVTIVLTAQISATPVVAMALNKGK